VEERDFFIDENLDFDVSLLFKLEVLGLGELRILLRLEIWASIFL
jgi:hypothetical protein